MKVYEKRTDNLTYIGYWTISTFKGIYAALFADLTKINSFKIIPMNEIGDLQENSGFEAEAKQVDTDLRICYNYMTHKGEIIRVNDAYSIGGKSATFNHFTLVNEMTVSMTKNEIIHFGKREEVNVYKLTLN